MKILQSLNFRWWNGSAEYAVTLSKDLAGLGHDVLTVLRRGAPSGERAMNMGIKVVSPAGLGSKNPIRSLIALGGILRLFMKEKVEVANLHDGESHLLGALASLFLGKRTKVVRTMSEAGSSKVNILNLILYRYLTDAVTVTNAVASELLSREFLLDSSRIFLIHPGIDTEAFSPGGFRGVLRTMLGIPPDCLLVGTVGRLSPVKGHYYLMKAASMLGNVENVRFVVSGRPEEIRHEDLKETARALGVETVFFFLDEFSDVREVVDDLDIAVVPSVASEEVSRVVLEFMSMGKPIIASSVGSIPELIEDGVTGYLVQPMDGAGLARRISELLEDREKRISIGKAGREDALRRFDRRTVARKVERVFASLVERKRT